MIFFIVVVVAVVVVKVVEVVLNASSCGAVQVVAVEAGLVGLEDRRAALLEEELQRIQDTLTFMSRRLDLTHVPDWVKGAQA